MQEITFLALQSILPLSSIVIFATEKPKHTARRKSVLWKCCLWLLVALLITQTLWLTTVPALRQTLKFERATPRVSWLELPYEIDLQAHPSYCRVKLSEGPRLLIPEVSELSVGNRLANLSLKSQIFWPNLPHLVEPWNMRLEMAVILVEGDRFLSTARGSMRPDYQSKKLTWQNTQKREALRVSADFFLTPGKKFYGYILRLFYKERMTSEFSEPENLAALFPSYHNTE